MPRRRRRAESTISFAEIGFATDRQEPLVGRVAALEESLRPGTQVSRYDRLWHIARWTREDDHIIGRIGFEPVGRQGELWDERAKDFREQEIRVAATTSRFVVDLNTFRVAFQLRGNVIKPGTFRGNFQALLNEAADWGWRVRLLGIDQPPWEDWREEVTRVVKLAISMRLPNPRFPGQHVEELFDRTKAAAIKLALDAPDGESINIDDELVLEAIELAKDYGNIDAVGERTTVAGEPEEVPWTDRAEGKAAKARVPADVNGEPLAEAMRTELQESPEGEGEE
jgi:hypothetical protein